MEIYSIKPERDLVWYSFVRAYQYPCWILIILSIPFNGMTLYLLYKLDREAHNMPLGNCIWDVTRIILWDYIQLTRRPGKVCILLITIMLGTLVFISDYLGEVTSPK